MLREPQVSHFMLVNTLKGEFSPWGQNGLVSVSARRWTQRCNLSYGYILVNRSEL